MATASPATTSQDPKTQPLDLPRELRDNLVARGFPSEELQKLVARPKRRHGLLRALRRDLLGV
jgi:hypothetical protein